MKYSANRNWKGRKTAKACFDVMDFEKMFEDMWITGAGWQQIAVLRGPDTTWRLI